MGRYRVLTLTQPLSRGVLQHTARAVTGLVLAGLVVAAAPIAAQDTRSQRNMVFILTDDQRFDGLGLLNEYFETPNLDTLAEGGVVFETAFVTTSLCSPSRASILSGLYAHTHQVLDNSTPMPPDIGERHDFGGGAAGGADTSPVGLRALGQRDDGPSVDPSGPEECGSGRTAKDGQQTGLDQGLHAKPVRSVCGRLVTEHGPPPSEWQKAHSDSYRYNRLVLGHLCLLSRARPSAYLQSSASCESAQEVKCLEYPSVGDSSSRPAPLRPRSC